MLRASMKYGAISAKVLALYGKLLKQDDWRRIYDCASPPEVLAVLKNHPGWSGHVSELFGAVDAGKLKTAIRAKQYRDFEKLYHFCSHEDKEVLSLLSGGAEYGCLLAALRCLYSGERVRLPELSARFIRGSGRVSVEKLENADSFAAVKSAAAESLFAPALEALETDAKTGLPDYSQTGAALERCYYQSVFSGITRKYRGSGRAELLRLLSAQADMLNIVGILRLHRYFPDSLQSARELLVPVFGRLKPRLATQLLSAGSEREAVELLKQSPFAEYFASYVPERLDGLYEKAMGSFCRKLIKMPEPNICAAAAYLTLSGQECDRLIRTIEALGYGMKPEEQ